jgi:flagellar basal-body rod modification protein FlgD
VAAAFRYDDAPVTLYGSPSSGADRADLVIRNAAGTEVYRGAMALSGESAAWAGTDSAGQPVPPGLYTGSVESFAGTRMIDSRTVETYARITEVRVEAGLAVLVLETGQKASLGDIGGLRAPVNG